LRDDAQLLRPVGGGAGLRPLRLVRPAPGGVRRGRRGGPDAVRFLSPKARKKRATRVGPGWLGEGYLTCQGEGGEREERLPETSLGGWRGPGRPRGEVASRKARSRSSFGS